MKTARSRIHWFIRALGPAISRVPPLEPIRAGAGALVGLAVAALVALSPSVDLRHGFYMIAPFGATSVLIFAVPNSPLAQPWSAIVGNTMSAAVGVAVVLFVDDPALRIALSTGLAICAMGFVRAIHPPAGAVAMTAALNPDTIHALGFQFALTPVAAGTTILVILGAVYARLTGRRYPFRQFDETNAQGTSDHPAPERLGLSEPELADILKRYRQSTNVGVEDLARLIAAAEMQAASHRTEQITAADIMSRDLVTVSPDTPFNEVAAIFRHHHFTSLPVVQPDGIYLGIIFQIHLLRRASFEAQTSKTSIRRTLSKLLRSKDRVGPNASDLMDSAVPSARVDTMLSELLPMLAEKGQDAIPILDGNCIIGIVTQTDLLAALVRHQMDALVRASQP